DWQGMLDLWLKLVDIMDRLKNSGQGDSLVSGNRFTTPRIDQMQRLIDVRRRKPCGRTSRMSFYSWPAVATWSRRGRNHRSRNYGWKPGNVSTASFQICVVTLLLKTPMSLRRAGRRKRRKQWRGKSK